MISAVDTSPVQTFVTALVERDFSTLERTMAEHVEFRALVPPGFRECHTSAAARELIQTWFGEADIFDVQYSTVETIGERVHAGYRVRLREDGDWYLCEQHLFAHTADGLIDKLDVLCSGFTRLPAITGVVARNNDYRQESESSGLDWAIRRSPA